MSSNSRIKIFDGGMGTTLEASGHDISSCLWSADPKLAGAVQDVHEGFLEAGADLVGSATYQAAVPLYKQMDSSLSEDAIASLMRDNFSIARRAAANRNGKGKENAGVVLSLGPYGATLYPGQEYSGCYPPPYGPRVWSRDEPNTNTYPSDSSEETASISALRSFHFSRLLIYASDPETWRSVDWIGFETIPVLREGIAIRLAMRDLEERLQEMYGDDTWWKKKFWTSFVFPSGKAPDGSSVELIVGKMLTPESSPNGSSPVPSGIGINCTSPAYISTLSESFTEAFRDLSPANDVSFVLYPDGGLVYDPVTKTWSETSPSGTGGITGQTWAANVAQVAIDLSNATIQRLDRKEDYVWKEVIVGGCCKAGYEEIRGLRGAITSSD